jgi:futalosine hydrolase
MSTTTSSSQARMQILIVAATDAEVGGLVARLGGRRRLGDRLWETSSDGRDVHLLITGVGMVATAAWCSRALAERPYDIALNAGLCGSFVDSLVPGTVVHVVADCLAELGAEDGDRFLTLQDLGLEDRADARLGCAELRNAAPPPIAALDRLEKVRGITVNTAHGHESSIAAVVERLHPQVESMEGAAFMYACLMHKVSFAQIRAVSNVVERRNRSAWKVQEAIEALAGAVAEIVTGS